MATERNSMAGRQAGRMTLPLRSCLAIIGARNKISWPTNSRLKSSSRGPEEGFTFPIRRGVFCLLCCCTLNMVRSAAGREGSPLLPEFHFRFVPFPFPQSRHIVFIGRICWRFFHLISSRGQTAELICIWAVLHVRTEGVEWRRMLPLTSVAAALWYWHASEFNKKRI